MFLSDGRAADTVSEASGSGAEFRNESYQLGKDDGC